jgi:hypothetical protein
MDNISSACTSGPTTGASGLIAHSSEQVYLLEARFLDQSTRLRLLGSVGLDVLAIAVAVWRLRAFLTLQVQRAGLPASIMPSPGYGRSLWEGTGGALTIGAYLLRQMTLRSIFEGTASV